MLLVGVAATPLAKVSAQEAPAVEAREGEWVSPAEARERRRAQKSAERRAARHARREAERLERLEQARRERQGGQPVESPQEVLAEEATSPSAIEAEADAGESAPEPEEPVVTSAPVVPPASEVSEASAPSPSAAMPAKPIAPRTTAQKARPRSSRLPHFFSYLSVGAGALGGFRTFDHHEPSTGEHRQYRAKGFSGLIFMLELRPPAFRSLLSWSLKADFWRSNALTSYSRQEKKIIDSPSSRMQALAQGLLQLGKSAYSPIVGLGAGAGYWTFEFDLPDRPGVELPNGNYGFARAQADLRIPLKRLSLIAESSLLYVFYVGDLGSRQASSSAPVGMENTVGLSLALPRNFEIRVRASYTYFTYDLKPLPGSKALPAGVTDEYRSLSWTAHLSF
jgi:hypothetical protein